MNPESNLPAPSFPLPTVLPTAPWTKECSLPVDVGLAHLTPPGLLQHTFFLAEVLKLDSLCCAWGWHGWELMGNFQQCWRTQILFSFPSWSFAISATGAMLSGSKHEANWIAKAAVLGGTEKPELWNSNGLWMQNRMEEAPAGGRRWISPACPRWPCQSTMETQGWQSHPTTLLIPSSPSPHHQMGCLKNELEKNDNQITNK